MRFETRATQISYGPPNFRVVCREALRKMSLSLIKICTMFLTRKWTFSICCRHCGGGQSAPPNNSVSESKCSLKSKSPTSYPKRRFLTCLTLKNHKSITTYFLLQGLIQVFRGGHRRFLLTLGIRSPRKNVQLHARISDQETGKIHLAIFSIPKPKVWFVSWLSITMMYFSLSFLFSPSSAIFVSFLSKSRWKREMLSSRYTEQIQSFPSTSLSYMCSRKQSMAMLRQTGKRNNDP